MCFCKCHPSSVGEWIEDIDPASHWSENPDVFRMIICSAIRKTVVGSYLEIEERSSRISMRPPAWSHHFPRLILIRSFSIVRDLSASDALEGLLRRQKQGCHPTLDPGGIEARGNRRS